MIYNLFVSYHFWFSRAEYEALMKLKITPSPLTNGDVKIGRYDVYCSEVDGF